MGQVCSLRALPQPPQDKMRRGLFGSPVSAPDDSLSSQRKSWLLWLCRATAKVNPIQYSNKSSSNS